METNILALFAAHVWILGGGYIGMFIIMLIEGPGITAIGGFAARLGFFNIWLVLLLSILGNFIPDIVFYLIGLWGRATFIDKYGHRFGISKERMQSIEKLYQVHPFATLLVVKLIPFLPPTGLAAAGAARMSLKKYSFWSLVITLLTSGVFLGIGYYLGETYIRFASYQGYALAAIGAGIFLIAYSYKKFRAWLGKKLGEKLAPAELN
jgi:membrane protein DedA with SNARE-associated domain